MHIQRNLLQTLKADETYRIHEIDSLKMNYLPDAEDQSMIKEGDPLVIICHRL